MMAMETKKFKGAPFGIQKPRFEVAGIHPKRKPPGTITQVTYDKKSMLPLNRKLGPGTYNVDSGSFSAKSVSQQCSGPGWQRAYESAQSAKIPILLYREEWQKKQIQKRMLGPGTYNIPDSFYDEQTKPTSTRGVCKTRAPRFATADKNTVPGPGAYGKGGIPHSLLEERQRTSASTVGMLDKGASGKRELPEVGSALCPGQYNCKSFIDELSERVVSKRGPYDLFTGERSDDTNKNRGRMGPGEYEIKSFIDNWNDEHRSRHGKFGTVKRCQDIPSERIYCKTLSQWPRKPLEPGPGYYTVKEQTRPSAHVRKPFGSSAKRNDTNNFSGSKSCVGPGRYNITEWKERQHKNGHCSAFISNTKRWHASRDKYLKERIRSKDVPVKDRVFLVPIQA